MSKNTYKPTIVLNLLIYISITYSLSYICAWTKHRIAIKKKEEKEYFLNGGSVQTLNKCIKKRNKLARKLKLVEQSEADKFKHLLIYTNDTSSEMSVLLLPQYKFTSKEDSYDDFVPKIQECQDLSYKMNEFIKNSSFYGFNIFAVNSLKNDGISLVYSHHNNKDSYRLSYHFYYTEKQKKILKERILKYSNKDYERTLGSKKKQIEALEGLQFKTFIIDEERLLKRKNTVLVWMEVFDFYLDQVENGVFYFSCYNKQVDIKKFSKMIALLKSKFPKNARKNLKGQIRSFKVTPTNVSYEYWE